MQPRFATPTSNLNTEDLFSDLEPDDTGSFPIFVMPTSEHPVFEGTVRAPVPAEPEPAVEGRDAEADAALSESRMAADRDDWAAACAAGARALDRAPSDPEIHAAMAWYKYRLPTLDPAERKRLAEHHLAVSFELRPNNPHAHTYQGRILLQKGNPIRARKAFSAALASRPGFEPALVALSRLDGAKTTKGIPVFRESRDSGPTVAALPSARRPRRTPRFLVLAALVAVAIALPLHLLNAAEDDHRQLADDLGTGLRLVSAQKGDGELRLDFGAAWTPLPPSWREEEIQIIAKGAAGMGYRHVYVYGGAERIGEAHDGKVCMAEACARR